MNVRLTIVLVLVLILIGGLVAVTQVLRSGSDNVPERKARLYRISSAELVGIELTQLGPDKIEKGTDRIEFVAVYSADGNREWFIRKENGGDVAVDVKRWGGIPALVGGPSVIRDLSDDEGALDLSVYGLDQPKRHIYLTLKQGIRIDVEVGDDDPTSRGYYVKVAGTRPLFIVTKEWVDVIMGLLSDPPYQAEDVETG
ncbi:DUF4340 domain-containing protein [SAR202 cluster bacterium AD-804-J14_MRT_500m]|nr:DUF4340 domain-containing protein [SAR202 cluster bacterium AD-804-J14_MRT_500m]